jgi:hypothetical protein
MCGSREGFEFAVASVSKLPTLAASLQSHSEAGGLLFASLKMSCATCRDSNVR